MIRIRQIEIDINNDNLDCLKNKCAKKLRIDTSKIKDLFIHKKSIDARHKPDIYFVYEVDIDIDDEIKVLNKIKSNDIFITPYEEYIFP